MASRPKSRNCGSYFASLLTLQADRANSCRMDDGNTRTMPTRMPTTEMGVTRIAITTPEMAMRRAEAVHAAKRIRKRHTKPCSSTHSWCPCLW